MDLHDDYRLDIKYALKEIADFNLPEPHPARFVMRMDGFIRYESMLSDEENENIKEALRAKFPKHF
jgi:hypothetical protein